MKVIIAGSRSITDLSLIAIAMYESNLVATVTEVISGGARGVDQLGEQWARLLEIPVKRFLADWSLFGKSAGMKRNAQMAAYADALVAIWDGKSSGTKNMIQTARKAGLIVYVEKV